MQQIWSLPAQSGDTEGTTEKIVPVLKGTLGWLVSDCDVFKYVESDVDYDAKLIDKISIIIESINKRSNNCPFFDKIGIDTGRIDGKLERCIRISYAYGRLEHEIEEYSPEDEPETLDAIFEIKRMMHIQISDFLNCPIDKEADDGKSE